MKVKNELEGAVRAEVGRRKEAGRGIHSHCWCSLCEADITALALTILPPRYTTTHHPALSREKDSTMAVRNAVFTSMKRVSRRSKHRASSPETQAARVRVVNYGYDEGISKVASLMTRSDSPCGCAQCQADTLAYALNRYPPKYGVLHSGRTNLPSYQLDFLRHELGLMISHAAGVVASRPRHRVPIDN